MITTQQLQLLKEGNKKAFEALYRAYNARIYSFVLSMIGDAGVAKDITQDIFLQIWEKRLNIDLEVILTVIFLRYPKIWYTIT